MQPPRLDQSLPLRRPGQIKRWQSISSPVLFVIGLGLTIALLPTSLVALLMVGCSFVLISLIYPTLGLYLLIPIIPFSSLFQVHLNGLNFGPMEALLGLMLSTWGVRMAAKQRLVMPHPPLLWPFLLFLSAIALSWLTTFSARESLIETVKWIEMGAVYLFIVANCPRSASRWLILLLLLSGLAEAVLGLYQFIFKVGPAGFLLFEGTFLRAYGTFRQPNPYAGYLGLILPLAMAIGLWFIDSSLDKGQRTKDKGQRTELLIGATAIISTGLLLAALYASQSRGAWIGFGVALMVTLLALGRHWAVFLGLGLIGGAGTIALGGLTLLPSSIWQRFADAIPLFGFSDLAQLKLTHANFSTLERLAHWQAAYDMWRDHVWLGVGFGNYEAIYPTYAIGRWQDPLGHAHNYILNLGAEIGYIGLGAYLIFWAWVIIYLLSLLRHRRRASFEQAILGGCFGILAHLHTHNLLDNLYVQGMYLHLAIILGLITLIGQRQQKGQYVFE